MTSSSRPGARVILRVGNLLTRQEVLQSSGGSSPDLLEKPGDTPGQDENSASEYWGNIDLGDTGAARGSARSLAGCVTWDESFSLDVQSGPQVAIWLCDMGRGGNRSCTMRSLLKQQDDLHSGARRGAAETRVLHGDSGHRVCHRPGLLSLYAA